MDQLSIVKQTIENALADGKLSSQESEMIKKAIYHDRKVSTEEAALWRELQTKVANGEISID